VADIASVTSPVADHAARPHLTRRSAPIPLLRLAHGPTDQAARNIKFCPVSSGSGERRAVRLGPAHGKPPAGVARKFKAAVELQLCRLDERARFCHIPLSAGQGSGARRSSERRLDSDGLQRLLLRRGLRAARNGERSDVVACCFEVAAEAVDIGAPDIEQAQGLAGAPGGEVAQVQSAMALL
jgi:hypothetical protein